MFVFQLQIMSEFGLDKAQVSQSVTSLVEDIWQQAAGEISEIIRSPLRSIKLEQVNYLLTPKE